MSILLDLTDIQKQKLRKHRENLIKKGTFRTNNQLNRHIAKMRKFIISGHSIRSADKQATITNNNLFTFKVIVKKKRKRRKGIF